MLSLEENVEEANKIVTELETEYTFGSSAAEDVQRRDKTEMAKQPSAVKNSGRGDKAALSRSKSNTDMLESLDEFFKGLEGVNNNDSLPCAQKEYHIATGTGEDGSVTPRIFTRSFDELENSIRGLRLQHIDLSTDDDSPDEDGTVKVKDFAFRTPLPSPATLLERREALCARESTWEHRLIGGEIVHSRRPHRAQTVDERGGGLDAWLAESPSPDMTMERASTIRSRVPHRQQTL